MGQAHPISMAAKILVVEDEALIGEMIADALQEQGFEVLVTASAAAALAHIQSGAQVDALFTDVNLPGEMNGAELANRVRALRPEIPIVYASGHWSPSDRDRPVARSVFLPKPYDPRDAGDLLMRLVAMH